MNVSMNVSTGDGSTGGGSGRGTPNGYIGSASGTSTASTPTLPSSVMEESIDPSPTPFAVTSSPDGPPAGHTMAYFIPVTTNEGTSCYVLPAPQVVDDSGSPSLPFSSSSLPFSSSSVTKSNPATCVTVLSTNNPVTVAPPTSPPGLVHGHHHHHHHVQHHHGPLLSTGTTVLALPTPEGGYTLATASTTPGSPGAPVTTSKIPNTSPARALLLTLLLRALSLFYCVDN